MSEIGLGLRGISGDETWGQQDTQRAIDTVRAGIDEEITFLDTAEKYGDGQSERLLGRAIAGYDRSDLVIASKVSDRNPRPDDLNVACDRSPERLDTEYIDVCNIHWPP